MSPTLYDLFVFEMANNHQGSVEHGLRIIDEVEEVVRRHGIKAGVKLQYRELDSFIHPDYRQRDDVPHVPRFLETRLTDDEFTRLVGAIRDRDMLPIVTPFDEASVDRCLCDEVPVLKVASCSATDWPLLEKVAGTGRPVIISTGGLTIYEIDNLASFFGHREVEFGLMHCIALYPTPAKAVQLAFMDRMVRRYPRVPVGYSGHEAPDETDVVKVAVSIGARMLERHVGVPRGDISLNAYSMNPEQLERWVISAVRARAIRGTGGEKEISEEELVSLRSLKRGVYAGRRIEVGESIEDEDVFFAMPLDEGQLTSGEFGQYRTSFRASKTYAPNEPIKESAQQDLMSEIRGIIHDAKGMIYEANIALGNDFEVELSHHYGLDRFRQWGAVIVNLVNREYCKKLVVMLPGQRHPKHRHRRKEETFQLLSGDLEVDLGNETRRLKPGDKVLVERETWHGFSTRNGAIFEEVSTTHHGEDSYYRDEMIARLDPMERKTVLDGW